ncbi:leucyl aminopeptidase family protein [Shewanella sp. D64]|uniref:leucyl aminopeptidase family protein n=1 Tax=unclassified Shewanella TaxID=196818 RepID=UPI0022BA22B9|nr:MULTISPECIES: leucyl aminopeptidase family protein [unclassified Shewanella]MEC4726943.1 leucyl aminopeptidase family protein [Shewanella sp. D64]MEC4738560.1 leucyl aminopeptidase family protein [Shewanella sp. E94]WBJ93778.1 leucyl aminopeptidase family protein [Shewanella sp. MTB7]
MTDLLISGVSGTPLSILHADAFDAWLAEQAPQTKNWLTSTQFSGKGMSLIPSANGELSQAIFVTSEPESYWVCGDLVNLLPAGQYQIKATEEQIKVAAFSWGLGTYKFDRYKKNDKQYPTLVIDNPKIVEQAKKLIRSISMVRDLVNTPAADMMPQHLGDTMEALADEFGAKITQIIGDELLEQNYPTIHMVGRASENLPRLIDLTWGDESAPKVTLVGKGVCFDSGGLDLKPGAGMRFMKKDMGGAAHVIGLAHQIMASNLPIRLRVLVPAVENAVSANAFRPGDVIKTRKGITVEIDNTDAEGRLVLCDALAEANNDKPDLMIDFATLTGAMRIALGTELPGFFSNDDQVAADMTQSGLNVQDPIWRMPLHKPYFDLTTSDIADLANCGRVPQGGAITAALYLEAFVDKDISWSHFDVMAWNTRKLPGRPIGGEAFGIRAVFDYLQTRFEK